MLWGADSSGDSVAVFSTEATTVSTGATVASATGWVSLEKFGCNWTLDKSGPSRLLWLEAKGASCWFKSQGWSANNGFAWTSHGLAPREFSVGLVPVSLTGLSVSCKSVMVLIINN